MSAAAHLHVCARWPLHWLPLWVALVYDAAACLQFIGVALRDDARRKNKDEISSHLFPQDGQSDPSEFIEETVGSSHVSSRED